MPSAYLQWRFHSGERVVARGPLVFVLLQLSGILNSIYTFAGEKNISQKNYLYAFFMYLFLFQQTALS